MTRTNMFAFTLTPDELNSEKIEGVISHVRLKNNIPKRAVGTFSPITYPNGLKTTAYCWVWKD